MSLFPIKYLFEELISKAFDLDIRKPKIPDYIKDNLRFELFDWQQKALLNFLLYQDIKQVEEDNNPTHLLFNMATGTGKTLLMAAVILYYYKQGKNKFIFFVNQNNIVGKTEDNLTNPLHNKYLFQQNIVVDDKIVNIKKVDSFSNYDEDIQILFTTIHGLHNSVYKVKEDSIFLEQLQKDDIIMLGDEAHHLNATTKKKKGAVQEELEIITALSEKASQDQIEKSWEHTVIELLLNKGKKINTSPNHNALIEFTATVPDNEEVKKKYVPKTIHKFDLKDFLKAGYTKEINLVSSSFDKRKRVLQTLLFNWYRNEIALKYNIPNFKPVILFRSKYIDKEQQNNSQEDYEFFINLIKDLKGEDFSFLNEFDEEALFNITELYKKGQSRIIDIKRYMLENKLTSSNIITYLQGAFVERNCIITNSKKGTKTIEKTEAETERLLNSLEDKNNHIRAIFTVQRLTEGWDVLNLYDIVRMYEGRDEGKDEKGDRKAGKSTTSEVQLIGRGVRYYPFEFEGKEKNKRKFDNQLNHELRVLEEFYFHSDNNEKYLNELKNELKRQELLPDKDKFLKTYQLKQTFIDSDKEFYNNIKLYYNNRLTNPNKRKSTLKEVKDSFDFFYKVETFKINETTVNFEVNENDTTRFKQGTSDSKTLALVLKNFENHIIRKAINSIAKRDNSLLRFNRLKEELNINSIDEIMKDDLLGLFPITLIVPKTYNNLDDVVNVNQLSALIRFFEKVTLELQLISNPYIGSEFVAIPFKEMDVWYKEKSIEEEQENIDLERDLKDKDWYIYNGFSGTSEERNLINFLKDTMANFESEYGKVFLLRNEEVYKIYDFEKGRGFQPDFLLFLKSSKEELLYYQVFIEPKGSQFEDASGNFKEGKEGWKETFLEQITEKYGVEKVLKAENKDYKLFGLPLYNAKNTVNFKKAVKDCLEIEV
ncbi:type III restriction endonuclease [Flavobacterium rhamnosiphilum]|uniref:Type III restriction endonuclease n=1 Tax=Flavobacterium rhamnosiphilum TaxID=2541724 RepID=A0A4R5F388_9FLAO|nr:DEAD/DEAH box helicase family protein [Flavobacterium rhamnosiphilum]TDE41988.1 type III restriction endonuclease [Flavobacterium rhamnosiphilum]